jgi:hypothetical protein
MTIHGPFFRTVLLSTTVFGVLFSLVPRSFGAEEARPIASLTPEERSTGLPDNTVVTLKSGRTATLGVLRAEHRARLERFTKAAELGKMVAAKLAAQLASSTQPHHAATGGPGAKVPSPTPTPKQSGVANPSGVPGPTLSGQARTTAETAPAPRPTLSGQGRITGETAPAALLVPLMIPWDPQSYNEPPLPKDWLDFCHAASASTCIYLPANTTFYIAAGGDDSVDALDNDPLNTDENLCVYNGGVFEGKALICQFVYPASYYGDFKPTGALSTTASCDPPNTYVIDDKGAVKVAVSYDHTTDMITTGSTAAICVVQVSMSL